MSSQCPLNQSEDEWDGLLWRIHARSVSFLISCRIHCLIAASACLNRYKTFDSNWYVSCMLAERTFSDLQLKIESLRP